MKHSHGTHGTHAGHGVPKGPGANAASNHLVKGAAMSAGAHTGKKLMQKISKHPLLLIGIGAVAGYFVHKYRKEIIASVSSATDRSKDFVLQQKENLEDIVAETKESEE